MGAHTQLELRGIARACAEKIVAAKDGVCYFDEPFRHVVIDAFFDPRLAELCLSSFPPLDAPCWEHARNGDIEVKSRTTWTSEFDIPDGLVDAIRVLNAAPTLGAISARMGIPKIVPDPYFSGGGLNVTQPGGLLDVHVDGNFHDATGLNRRLNVIVYLNPGWQPSWGGEFGIYDREGRVCVKKVAPLFNRLVIFDSHDFSFHGLPDPITFPEGTTRKSIILYYYTKEPRPSHQVAVSEPHSALWVKRGLNDKQGKNTRPVR